jgi:glycosyltransferase involved in cell wall biosynthesis
MLNNKKILITTGIYPPKIGGPAQYAKNLKDSFEKLGCTVEVKTYGLEEFLPIGLRHYYFMIKIIPSLVRSDFVVSLDTFSAGFPTVLASVMFGKKNIIRTGGDFLWEQYVERTHKKVLLKDFYKTEMDNFSIKEKIIFKFTKWLLNNTSQIVFSTSWQRDIFVDVYGIPEVKTSIIENYYGQKVAVGSEYDKKEFVASGRGIFVKNTDFLNDAFDSIVENVHDVSLFMDRLPFEEFMEKVKNSYAIINVSISEISPNFILDAIRYNKPFICTREVGIYDRIKDIGIFVDPLNKDDIKNAIKYLLDKDNYNKVLDKVSGFSFTHSWEDISKEFVEIFNKI